MGKAGLSVLLSVLLSAGLAGGLYLHHRLGEAWHSSQGVAVELSALREEVAAAREDMGTLIESFRRLESAPPAPSGDPSEDPAAVPSRDAALPEPAPLVGPDGLKTLVMATLEEERKQREEERKHERDEAKKRFEARRKEEEALKEGPYERFNLKINSLSKVLALNDAQKQAYYELSKQAGDKLQEGRKKLAQEAAAQKAAEEQGRGRGPGREERGRSRELYEGVQKEFAAAVQGILTPSQLEAYNQLSGPTRSFQSLGMVSARGEGGGEPPRQRPGGLPDRRESGRRR